MWDIPCLAPTAFDRDFLYTRDYIRDFQEMLHGHIHEEPQP